jgi:antitoxin component of MazEF toxin-antitoxin module
MEQVIIRRVGPSLYIRVPPSYLKAKNLKPGDSFFWIPREGGVTLKIVTPEMVGEIMEEETVEGA